MEGLLIEEFLLVVPEALSILTGACRHLTKESALILDLPHPTLTWELQDLPSSNASVHVWAPLTVHPLLTAHPFHHSA